MGMVSSPLVVIDDVFNKWQVWKERWRI